MKNKSFIGKLASSNEIIRNKRGLPSRAEGGDGSITFRQYKGDTVLCYRLGNVWYYVKMSKDISKAYSESLTSPGPILKNKFPSSKNEVYLKNNVPYINNRVKKEILLNDSKVDIKSKSLSLDGDISIYGNYLTIESFAVGDGAVLHIDSSKVIDKYTDTGGTATEFNFTRIEGPTLASTNSSVTTTSASTLKLGVPTAGDNQTLTNAYSLSLEGNIESTNLTIVDSGDVTLDSAGDITLDAAGVDINFAVAATNYLNWNAVNGLTMYNVSDTGDTVNLLVGSNGKLTITTQDDSDSDLAHFIVDAEGGIKFDSSSGGFVWKKSGVEFSAVNSAYAGMILGYTRIQNDSTTTGHNVISVDTTMTVLETAQGTECKVTFVAPPSGNVEIQFHAAFNTQDTYYLSVSTAASYAEHDETHTYDFICIKNDETDVSLHTISFAITGLTAGTTYNRWIAAKVASGAGDINHGRNRSAGTHAPPIIIKAIALPAIITTGE